MIETILNAGMYPFLFLTLYFQVFLLLSFFEREKKIKKEQVISLPKVLPSLTIAVPCWNEEKTLPGTLDSLMMLEYPKEKLKIVVVDDGSQDGTYEIAKAYEERYKGTITAYRKENGGKHTAVNYALERADTDLFGCLDADSFVESYALTEIVNYFTRDKEVMAVTPCIHIKNPTTIVQRLQAIEYLMGVFLRKVYGELDAIQVTPGPFSIFRREVFEKLGPYKKAYNTEDFEITLRMHRAHMKIANAHRATVYTFGPSTFIGYYKQRLRWARGFLENALDYKDLFFKKSYGNFGMFTLPGAVIFVFYTVYATAFFLYHGVSFLYEKSKHLYLVGVEPLTFNFDPFYLNTSTMSLIGFVMFGGFILVLAIAQELTNDRQEFLKNFPFFLLIFPFLGPVYMTKAVYDTMMRREAVWALQDNKVSDKVTVTSS